ncbi:MAG: hypothetical protein JSS11_17075 [Verrucomicrobia bacterium]|nr:hypothetical protein [Verrucomicrobiota bacterium]
MAVNLDFLKPTSKQLVYDLVTVAGVDTSDWSNYSRPIPASNPKYCYNWSFEGVDRVVICLWFVEMKPDGESVVQRLNYREIAASPRKWKSNQRKRAAAMDHAIQLSKNKRWPIRVIVVDGSRRSDADDETRSRVERRMLDIESWHVAAYEDDGNCLLRRGAWPIAHETFTPAEILAAGTFNEGALEKAPTQMRDRSQRLRNLARSYFIEHSKDGRLRCTICAWAPPTVLKLSGPIVEIHHGVGISTYPEEGKALTFEEAIKHLTPFCPNCHRIVHAKSGGGMFTVEELRSVIGASE